MTQQSEQSQKVYRILIVEDELIVAKNLAMHLQKNKELRTDIASNYSQALQKAKNDRFELIIADIDLKGRKSGLDLIQHLREEMFFPPAVIFLTSFTDEEHLQQIKALKPQAYLPKPYHPKAIEMAVELILQNQEQTPDDRTYFKLQELTQREVQIIRLISKGYNNSQIAEKLYISSQTVSTHRKNIYKKLGVNNTASLMEIVQFLNNYLVPQKI
jgi:DNA-binding NarL/FixJ family response regulator